MYRSGNKFRQSDVVFEKKLARFFAIATVLLLSSVVIAGITIVTQPQFGRLNVTPSTVEYVPNPGFTGTDQFVISHSGLTPRVLYEGETDVVFSENAKEFSIPVTLTKHADGTYDVRFGKAR